ncbi:MAG: nucleotide exchange factor GrpE [Phocaeicola sp.]|uniref:nucleotide exchange factor GrpE n=1 Tax=Phocaeicola TaxID=909656 RepID=UPI00234E4D37|nr:nucleotide exchange factor GrpE [Phocaeicola oris]MCE2617673.1 nucleotide exchange factor GrpE [Phocaeicola oris]
MNPNENIKKSQEEEIKAEAEQPETAPQRNEEGTESKSQEETKEEVEQSTTEVNSAEELEEAKKTIEEDKDKYLRLSAEFDNYRKRTIKEKAELILNGGEKVIKSILPIIDDMERAIINLDTVKELKPAKEGIELIYNKFIKALESQGVKKIETEEKEFNTDFFEAIAMIPAPSEDKKGKVLDCVQTGYTLNGKVIRHAKVAVGQ